MHDLHESVTLLYTSTGTGPYNSVVDPIQVNEWWLLAQTEIMEMTKRGVPGVWTYNYYDGWVPNYMFWIGVTHNSIGRFYETQSYRRRRQPSAAGARRAASGIGRTRRRRTCTWGPRNNVNMQQSALLHRDELRREEQGDVPRELLPEEQAHDRARQDARRRTPTSFPRSQRRRVEAAELMNLIRREGAEVHTASARVHARQRPGRAGDYIVRMDQPYGAIVETLLGVQFYAPENPRPYDDTGWAIPLVRNVKSDARRRQGDPRQADDARDGRLQDRRRDRRHRPRR